MCSLTAKYGIIWEHEHNFEQLSWCDTGYIGLNMQTIHGILFPTLSIATVNWMMVCLFTGNSEMIFMAKTMVFPPEGFPNKTNPLFTARDMKLLVYSQAFSPALLGAIIPSTLDLNLLSSEIFAPENRFLFSILEKLRSPTKT